MVVWSRWRFCLLLHFGITESNLTVQYVSSSEFQTKTKQKKWRIKARWTKEVVAKIKLQIISCFRNRQTRKQNKGEQKTLTNVIWDPRRNGWLKTVENDLKWLRKMVQQS